MYSPKISEDQVVRLYRLKLSLLANGERGITLTQLVQIALEKFLNSEEMKIQTSKDRVYNFLAEPPEEELKAGKS